MGKERFQAILDRLGAKPLAKNPAIREIRYSSFRDTQPKEKWGSLIWQILFFRSKELDVQYEALKKQLFESMLYSTGKSFFIGDIDPQEDELSGDWTRTENGYWLVKPDDLGVQQDDTLIYGNWALIKAVSEDLPSIFKEERFEKMEQRELQKFMEENRILKILVSYYDDEPWWFTSSGLE